MNQNFTVVSIEQSFSPSCFVELRLLVLPSEEHKVEIIVCTRMAN